MSRMLHDKTFYRTFAILTLSLALQNLLTYSVNLADNIMLGRFSQDALSGASLCNQLQFFLQMLVQGVGEGVVVLGARYWGKKDLKPIPDIIGAGLRFGVSIAAVLFVLALLFPTQIIRLMTNDPVIMEQAVQYLQIICFTYVIFALTNMLTASLRSIGIVKIGYIISASTLCINICLNYVLIYGHFGAPALGVRGAAIATLVSRTVELLIVIWFLKFREHTLRLNWRKLLFIDTSYIKDYIHVSLPMLVTQTMWGASSIIQTAILGNMENAAMVVPANSISVLVFQILSVVGYGAASAAAIMTGRTLGEGHKERIDQTAFTFQIMFCIIGVFTGLIILLSRGPVLQIYNTLSPEAAELTRQFITVLAITSVGTCYQMAADCGILRAGGDTRFAMWNNIVFVWLICLPCAALSAFVFHFSPVVVFFCLKMEQLGKCPVIFLRVRSKKWIKQITR
ncbi:MATE family efflux transporter [Butyricicoccus pullicaecorum]|uniref:MATE efflux family protein n=1 Tax=Butyricicoccus pullicaecorum 1.2 TaxID=1203606 RepID=R8VTW3_9FIRM|nr:MATE family efflux transporter [Butyricicoccus pullicaecorum]EOQ35948.1 MATE efflux family protein [Butyricicoccus pullicaecorum 1.2]SKA61408.1 putative efflux protein, MATE family [Butyricicoccus pullicaecorum DSM 23266]